MTLFKKMTPKVFSFFMAILVIAAVGCKKEDSTKPTNNMQFLTLQGCVKDVNGYPLSGVKVTTGDATAITDGKGEYSFSQAEVINKRVVVKFEKSGYFTLARSREKRDALFIAAVLYPNGNSNISLQTSFEASKAATLQIDDMKVVLAASSVVRADGSTYNGEVRAEMLYLDPNNENFSELMPGSDLMAIRTDNSETALISYGMSNLLLTDNAGNKLQLKSESPAQVTFPVPKGMENGAPSTMPLWHFDEEKGIWMEEGKATRQGSLYVGAVTHFSWWNLDYPAEQFSCRISVTDAQGNRHSGIKLRVGELPDELKAFADGLGMNPGDLACEQPKNGISELFGTALGPLRKALEKAIPDFTDLTGGGLPIGTIGPRGKSSVSEYIIIQGDWKDEDGESKYFIGIYRSLNPVQGGDKLTIPTIVIDGSVINLFDIPEVQVIPAGKKETFTMGCFDEDCPSNGREEPTHKVTLSHYYISKYPVTQLLWKAVMGSSAGGDCGIVTSGDEPAFGISWNEVQQFISKLNQLTGKKYRLPTEAEWEYAARGGAKSNGLKYSGSDNIKEVAWYNGIVFGAVGTKEPNELGIYDMSGNVWEWCSDCYGAYTENPQTDPTGPAEGDQRILRGGGYNSSAYECRVTYRNYAYTSSSHCNFGFRLVRVP